MCDLIALLRQCEDDTRRLLGKGEAERLSNWRRYIESRDALLAYIGDRLTGDRRINGWKLDQQGGLSLERIVIDHCPGLFTAQDITEAKLTLGLP